MEGALGQRDKQKPVKGQATDQTGFKAWDGDGRCVQGSMGNK